MSGKQVGLVVAALLLAVLLGVVVATVANADGPVVWKAHCPQHYDVVQVADRAGDGVHVLCVRSAEREEVTADNKG